MGGGLGPGPPAVLPPAVLCVCLPPALLPSPNPHPPPPSGIVREMLLTPFASGFFPTPPSPPLAPLSLIPTDRTMRNSLIQSGVPDLAHAVLRSTSFVNFSCSAFQ
eukprot:scaffold1499_cov111-Isochrysis_galbana.AAC.6